MINKYTLPQVTEIIDDHLDIERGFTFVCDFALAHYIYDYLHNDYGFQAESVELSSDIDEYYVSMSYFKDGDVLFICEPARCNDETYKYDEIDDIDYYIFSVMSKDVASGILCGKRSVLFWCRLVDNDYCDCDVCDECSQCIGCDEHCGRGNHDEEFEENRDCEDEELEEICEFCTCGSCTEKREQAVITEFLDMLFNPEGACKQCIIEKFIDSLYAFKDFGNREAKEDMIEFLED